ncbi:heme A synthase [Paracoccaceae bacterium GXU_MW_L88]
MAKNRKIFEDVATETREAPKAVPQRRDETKAKNRHQIAIWLMSLFVLVAAMIVVGGLTRLSDAGLSITEWKPVTGAIPPMSAADWDSEFALYQQIPQFSEMNPNMTLAEFKTIYWWEWGHRFLGRIVGLVWGVGFLYFLLAKKIPTGWTGRLLSLGILGGLQGVIGWWMVSSGLAGSERVSVASTRLATHLGLAFLIMSLIIWWVLRLGRSEAQLIQARRDRDKGLWGGATGLLHLAAFQIILGALVAGIDAGRNYTDWPMMGGTFVPYNFWDPALGWQNLIENPAPVQFFHRMVGYLLVILGAFMWWKARKAPIAAMRSAFALVAIMMLFQVALGIVTLLYAAPLNLAILHQTGAILLIVLILNARFTAGYPPAQSIRG